ncbi:MAG: imidazoleglycerol-phosphate dehydratase HisB [Ruminococcaceae bacterium]|nr:imidazoleglycerol-phosphate dehydratase HisB [Oscillospiraceae bacterium]
MRTSTIQRKTAETDIKIELNLDGSGQSSISTGCGFLNHMLTLFAKHGRFDLNVSCKGDTDVDFHHTTEDIGIALGQALKECVGDGAGITRYADIVLPMDEALILAAVDVCGRSYLGFGLELKAGKVGDFDTELVNEFFAALVGNFPISLHIKQLDGKNTHHIIEGAFKAVARVLSAALKINSDTAGEIPSTKGKLF